MANKIEPNAPLPPLVRKQVLTEDGTWKPAPIMADLAEMAESVTRAPDGLLPPRHHPPKIGDLVSLKGRIIEIQSPQGGQTSIKVQMPQGVVWLRGEHVEIVAENPEGETVGNVSTDPFITVGMWVHHSDFISSGRVIAINLMKDEGVMATLRFAGTDGLVERPIKDLTLADGETDAAPTA